MKEYTTQMDAARKGIITPQMEAVARKENMPVEKLIKLVAEGKVAICANKRAYLPGARGNRQHAAHQNQRKPGRFPRLQGL